MSVGIRAPESFDDFFGAVKISHRGHREILARDFAFLRMDAANGADPLTREIIGGAIEVHRVLGPGLLESKRRA